MQLLAILALLGSTGLSTVAMPFDLSSRTILATFQGEGAQIYECKAGAGGADWTFREPIASLIENGKTMGRHFAGPSWELDDGSQLRAKKAQSLPGATPSDVPLLKLDVVQNVGTGRLAQATEVYRLNTHAGVLQGPCRAPGELRSVPYSAEYVFAR